jgi:hypothetical protein
MAVVGVGSVGGDGRERWKRRSPKVNSGSSMMMI